MRKETGAEEIRRIVNLLNCCRESFLDTFTAEQLLVIGRAGRACEWDIYPDEWSDLQVEAALNGDAPRFKNVDGSIVPDHS